MRGKYVKKALLIRAAGLLWLAILAGCGHGSSAPATVGVGVGVALSAPGGTTLVVEGTTIEIDATVSGDSANAGVTWLLQNSNPAGSISSQTKTAFVFQAPATVVGATFATLTAISVTDPTQYASVTITVNGTPTILPPVVFPANANIPYTTYISAAGGNAPYTWAFTGTLPPGLALSGSTSAATAITGTPTTVGTSSFTLTLTDAFGLTASAPITLVVAPQTACLLQGPFAYLVTGYYNERAMTRAGSFTVTPTGTVTGIHDYNDGVDVRPATQVTSGACNTLTQNRGQLFFASSASGNETFDYATDASLVAGHMQQDDGTGVVDGGELFGQTAADFNTAALVGNWVFGAVGDDGSGHRYAVVGQLSLDAGGVVTGGVGDDNGSTPVVAGTISGTLAPPDATSGRGTTTLTVGSRSLPLAYYVIDANNVLLVTNGAQASSPRVAGRMTRQTNNGTLDSTAFSGQAILSMWGSSPSAGLPVSTITAGRLSGAVASMGVAAGTIGVETDTADRGAQSVNAILASQAYTVAPNGRGTLTLVNGTVTRQLVLYADGVGGGYVLEPASVTGNFGILDPQVAPPYSDFTTAYYVGGTMFPGSTSPITLAPQLLFQSGSIGGNLTGNYALDPTTGRMVAAVTRTILGGSDLVVYIVSQKKLVIMGDSLNISNSQLAWFSSY